MPHYSNSKILSEAAGVKIVMTSPGEEDVSSFAPKKITLTMLKINKTSDKSCGFHLTRSKWDPYPWVSYVENNSPAYLAGLRAGDCLLSINDTDLLGLRIRNVATLIRNEGIAHDTIFSVWRYPHQKEEQNDVGLALKGPLPDVARNLANALSGTVRALECPICLECAAPPVSQCVHGHILCVVCRPKTSRCPICRVRLGQGRCLLADKLHKVLRDTFSDASNDETANGSADNAFDRCNLRDQLFGGKSDKQRKTSASRKSDRSTLKSKQFLLTRLLLGDREKAVSADNLTRMSEMSVDGAACVSNDRTTVAENLRALSLNERAKSASTGELSRDKLGACVADSSTHIIGMNELHARNTVSQQSLNLPQTSAWGGSTDSVFPSVQLVCPFLQSCKETTTDCDSLLEHIRNHTAPQVHFYCGSARIPLPFPFGGDALYVFHHGGEVFFLQCREETAWMTCSVKASCANNTWVWILRAWGDNGTEVQLRRQVASLESQVTLSLQHIAPLPNMLSLKMINIQISEHRIHDGLYV